MGYRVDRRATLVLADMDGAEVDVRIGVPIVGVMEYEEADGLDASWAKFVELAEPAWNLEDAQGPIPADVDAPKRLPAPVVKAILREWHKATVEPPAPLPLPSSATAA